MTSESLPGVVEPEYLTDALRRSGTLRDGRVCNVVVENSKSTVLSRIVRLCLFYAGAASGAPGSLILKTGVPERVGAQWNSGRQEVAFYMQVATQRRHLWCRAASMPPGTMTRTIGTCCSKT